jgi:small-conductance mechanosensitive channel
VQIFNFVIRIIVVVFGSISIVKELGFDIGPILAGAGILGLAVGFGSQSLVKDIVSGFFLIMENQIRIGDVVKIANVSGQVEKMTLRIVILRDIEGIVHAIPNGEITTVSNMTYGWSRALIDIDVAYKEDIDKVMEVLKQIGDNLVHDEKFDKMITDDPIILGVDSLGESGVSIRVLFKTIPQKQWEVAREYKRRVKNEFSRLGIEIPFPHKTVYLRQEAIPAKNA